MVHPGCETVGASRIHTDASASGVPAGALKTVICADCFLVVHVSGMRTEKGVGSMAYAFVVTVAAWGAVGGTGTGAGADDELSSRPVASGGGGKADSASFQAPCCTKTSPLRWNSAASKARCWLRSPGVGAVTAGPSRGVSRRSKKADRAAGSTMA